MADVCLICSLEGFYNLPREHIFVSNDPTVRMLFLIFSLLLSCCILGLLTHTSYLESTSMFGEQQFSLKPSWILCFLSAC